MRKNLTLFGQSLIRNSLRKYSEQLNTVDNLLKRLKNGSKEAVYYYTQ
jgi:hypothetical protein